MRERVEEIRRELAASNHGHRVSLSDVGREAFSLLLQHYQHHPGTAPPTLPSSVDTLRCSWQGEAIDAAEADFVARFWDAWNQLLISMPHHRQIEVLVHPGGSEWNDLAGRAAAMVA